MNEEERITLFDRLLEKIFPKPPLLIPAGVYHAKREVDGVPTRLHLRVDYDGSGLLLANSQAATRLTPPGVIIAKGILDGEPEATIIKQVKKRFRGADKETMQRDMQKVQTLIQQIVTPGMAYPMLNFDAFLANKAQLMAPLKADVPLAPPDRLVPIIDKLWEVGIPNVLFLLPEHPDHTHVVRAIERAEDVGMIAGVRGRGTDLQQGTLLADMAQAGVDYITVLYASHNAAVHDALCGKGDHATAEHVLESIGAMEICPVAEIALVESTVETIYATLQMLKKRHIQTVSFFAIAHMVEQGITGSKDDRATKGALLMQALPQVETLLDELADEFNMQYLLQPLVAYDSTVSLASHVRQGPRCSGDVAVRVEPNGEVIPARGDYRSVGNILSEPWTHIWSNEAFRLFRESVD